MLYQTGQQFKRLQYETSHISHLPHPLPQNYITYVLTMLHQTIQQFKRLQCETTHISQRLVAIGEANEKCERYYIEVLHQSRDMKCTFSLQVHFMTDVVCFSLPGSMMLGTTDWVS